MAFFSKQPQKKVSSSGFRPRFESLETRLAMAFTSVGAPTQVSAYDPNWPTESSVAVDAAGNFVAVWSEGDGEFSNQNSRLYGRRFNHLGEPLGEPFKLNTLDNKPNSVKIQMTPDGRFVAVWQIGQFGDPNTTSIEVYFRRFAADGTPEGTEVLVSDAPDNGFPDSSPDVAINSSGAFVVSWNGVIPNDPLPTGTTHVFARRYNSDGQPLGNEFQVDVDTVCTNADSAVALRADGSFAVTWYWRAVKGVCGFTTDSDQLVRRFDATGSPIGNVESAFGDPYLTVGGASIALLGTNLNQSFVIADGSIDQILMQQIPKAGLPTTLDVEGDRSVSVSSFATSTSVVSVGWRRGSTNPVFRLYNTKGVPLTSVIEVAAQMGIVNGPQIAINESSLIATWSTNQGNFFQRYSFNPVAGDVDGNEQVDLQDFVLLRNHFGLSDQPRYQGDLTGDRVVDIHDFVELRRNFGQAAGAAAWSPPTQAAELKLAAAGAAFAAAAETTPERNRVRLAGNGLH